MAGEFQIAQHGRKNTEAARPSAPPAPPSEPKVDGTSAGLDISVIEERLKVDDTENTPDNESGTRKEKDDAADVAVLPWEAPVDTVNTLGNVGVFSPPGGDRDGKQGAALLPTQPKIETTVPGSVEELIRQAGVDPLLYVAAPALVLAITMMALTLFAFGRVKALRREHRRVLAAAGTQFNRKFDSVPAVLQHASDLVTGGITFARSLQTKVDVLARQQQDFIASEDRDRQLRALGVPLIENAIARIDTELAALAGDADMQVFDAVLNLGAALDALATGIDAIASGAAAHGDTGAPLAELFTKGIEDQWLEQLLRAEQTLKAYAPAGTRWAALGESIALVCGIARPVLGARGLEILTHPLLAPKVFAVRAYDTDKGELSRIGFIREVVQQAIGAKPPDHPIVIDCIRIGTSDRGRNRPPTVSLYNHLDWR